MGELKILTSEHIEERLSNIENYLKTRGELESKFSEKNLTPEQDEEIALKTEPDNIQRISMKLCSENDNSAAHGYIEEKDVILFKLRNDKIDEGS